MISLNDMGINDNSGGTATVSATAANAYKSYKDINDIVLEKLIYYNKSKENGDAVKSSNAFL
jgi:hypothetical protein